MRTPGRNGTGAHTRCLRVLDIRRPISDRAPDVLTEVRFDERSKLRACIGVLHNFRDQEVDGLAIQVCRTSPDSRWVDAARAVPFASFRDLVIEQWVFPHIRRGGLQCHFQPIVRRSSADEASVFGHECLIRCPLGDRYTIPAGHLFGLAWSDRLRRELHLASFWKCLRATAICPRDQRLFINVEPQFLPADQPFWNRVVNLLEENSFPARQVVLEIIESPSERDLRSMIAFADAARRMGMKIAIDDMGSQRDPLVLFRALQPDVIKLESDLVRHCTTDRWRKSLCEHLVSLAHDVGIECVLEGIEDDLDYRWALRQPVSLLQGYRFGRPGPQMLTTAELPADSLRRPHFPAPAILPPSGLSHLPALGAGI